MDREAAWANDPSGFLVTRGRVDLHDTVCRPALSGFRWPHAGLRRRTDRGAAGAPRARRLRHHRRYAEDTGPKEIDMSIGAILLIILVLFMVGAFPTWPHSASWGYFPSGGLGI